jgi:formate hydrogenlyase transcriptional activator
MDESAGSVGGKASPTRPPTDRARVLLEINNAVVSQLDLAQVLKAVSICLKREIKHDFAALALYNPEGHELRLHTLDFPEDPTFLRQGQLIPLVGTPASLAFSSRKTVLRHRPDLNEFSADIMKQAYARGIRSGCAVPLICRDKIVGSMALASLRESAFSEDDAELLTQIGAQVAIAVDNAQNFEKTRLAQSQAARERDRSQLLLEVNNAVVSHLDLREVLKSISASLARIMPSDSAFLTLCDPDCRMQRIQALDLGKLQDVVFEEGFVIPLEGTPEGEAIASRRPVLMSSADDILKFTSPWARYAVEHGVRSGCVLPLLVHERPLGALGVVSMQEAAFTEDDLRLLSQCSGQIAIAVENALNFDKARKAETEVRQERDRTKLLLDINNALVSHLDLSQLVHAISRSLQNVIQHECVGLAIYDSETGKMFAQAVSSVLDPMPEGIYYDPEGTTSGLTLKTGQPLYLPRPDYENFPSPVTHGFFNCGLKTLYSVPIA